MNFINILHCLKIKTNFCFILKDAPHSGWSGVCRKYSTAIEPSLKKNWYHSVTQVSYDLERNCYEIYLSSEECNNKELCYPTIEDLKQVTNLAINNENNYKYFYICNNGIIPLENPPKIDFLMES